MAGDIAERGEADGVQSVNAAPGAGGKRPVRQIRQEVRGGENRACGFLLLQGPLLLGRINQAEVIAAGNGLDLLRIGDWRSTRACA